MIIITLPYPPSVNRYRTIHTIPGHGARIGISKEGKQYKADVAWLAKKHGISSPLAGRVSVEIDLYPKRPQDWQKRAQRDPMGWDDDVQCIDLDNGQKVILDALKEVAFADDKWVHEIHARRMEPDGEARVIVRIEPIVRVAKQTDLPLVPAVIDPLAPEHLRAA